LLRWSYYCNVRGWYFVTVRPPTKPIEKLMLKLTTKGQMESGQPNIS
jgi:hypothetical protein